MKIIPPLCVQQRCVGRFCFKQFSSFVEDTCYITSRARSTHLKPLEQLVDRNTDNSAMHYPEVFNTKEVFGYCYWSIVVLRIQHQIVTAYHYLIVLKNDDVVGRQTYKIRLVGHAANKLLAAAC